MAQHTESVGAGRVTRHATAPAYRVGVDVGGTFTDLVAVEEGTGRRVTLKAPSTPRAPEEAVLDLLRQLTATLTDGDGSTTPSITLLCHSTTVATNALLGQLHLEPPRVGLLTTEGFRDVLEIGRQARSEVYNLFVVRPRPLVERRDRLGIPERLDARGAVLRPLDEDAVRAALEQLQRDGVRDVAVVFLHSYASPVHEQAVAQLAAAEFPALTVTLSSDVDPEYREYERASTTVVTAALRPIVGGYLTRLETGVRTQGIAAPLLVMGSHGGMADLEAAARRPAALIESGPAAGLAAAAEIARRLGLERALSVDMGGTTAKAGTVLGGAPETVAEFEAAGRTHSGRHVRGSGYPVRFPFLDLAEVSAGGGTIAYQDPAGALRVGPLSAGADPGPVCYARGGVDPTVTDANLLLGRLNPTHLLGGAMPVDRARAERSMAALAGRLGLETLELAAGIVRLINGDMTRALRIVSVERGHDPRRFAMIAFGGGGPLHACALAAALGVPRVIVPVEPGLFSAAGLLTSPLKVSLVRPVLTDAPTDPETGTPEPGTAESSTPAPGRRAHELEAIFAALEREAVAELERQGAAAQAITLARTLDLRYAGQSFELSIPAPAGEPLAALIARFHRRHHEIYGYASLDHAVEIVAARLTGTAPAAGAMAASSAVAPSKLIVSAPTPHDTREVYFDEFGGFVPTPVYRRDDVASGARLRGPAVIEQYDTTTLLHPGWSLEVDIAGHLTLQAPL